MITVYICSRDEWESGVLSKPKCLVHYFPETLYSYKDWSDFYNTISKGFHCVVSQSSELIKYLRVANVSSKVFINEGGEWVLYEDLEVVSKKLLSCYEEMMFKEFLFKD